MKTKNNIILSSLLLIVIISTACYFPTIMTADDARATEVDKAVNEILDQTAAANAAATYTPYPTYTPVPTFTPESYYRYDYDQYNHWYYWNKNRITNYCNDAVFLEETIPDNTIFRPGEPFTKTWVLRNTGQCVWDSGYHLVFTSGNSMGGDRYSVLPQDVPPGGVVEISVDMTAPSQYGTYKGYWAVESDTGYRFANFWVQIKVCR